MKDEKYLQARECLNFMNRCVSPYHVIETVEEKLKADGFTELKEKEEDRIKPGGSYYVKRNDSSLIAFNQFKVC